VAHTPLVPNTFSRSHVESIGAARTRSRSTYTPPFRLGRGCATPERLVSVSDEGGRRARGRFHRAFPGGRARGVFPRRL